ncbi:hypothetical protein ACVWY3_000307 [Bradyrhizobium sp. USDA 4486]
MNPAYEAGAASATMRQPHHQRTADVIYSDLDGMLASPRPKPAAIYRRTPTRLTPPFQLVELAVPARTAARATDRGRSTTPALATQLGG